MTSASKSEASSASDTAARALRTLCCPVRASSMGISGLQPNAPDTSSYQLWIFDEARDERFPVDGGVFNVPPGSGEIIVPIRPTLDVSRPVLFAVTVERPGGVMVSSRERIALVADPDA